MQQLSDEQVTFLANAISQGGVSNPGLQQGLLDHYCCHIEETMDAQGLDFETAYRLAFTAITPDGMQDIQEELFFLLTIKKQTNMKRIIYGAGFLATFLISSGFLFKNLHWPGASVILFTGFFALIVTLVTLLIHSMKFMKNYPPGYNLRMFSGFAAGTLISVGSMFKILHYPTANIQTVLGMAILNLVFLPLFFLHLYRKSIAGTKAA